MFGFFFTSLVFSLVLFIVRIVLTRVLTHRKHQQYVQSLVGKPILTTKKEIHKNIINKKFEYFLLHSPLTRLFNYLKNTYDIPKDLNILQLIFIQLGLIFICWNIAGFMNVSLFPLLLVAFAIEMIGVFFLLRRRKLLDRLDKAFPQILESLASMYHIHPDLKHSFTASSEIVSEPIAKRFLTELSSFTKVGVPTVQALQLMVKRWQYPPLTFLISSIQLHQSTGGNLAELFHQTSSSIRRHQQNTKAMQTVMFQNKVSGFIVCALVPLVLLLSLSFSKNYRAVLFDEPLARSLILAAIVWWIVGVFVMWKTLRVRV